VHWDNINDPERQQCSDLLQSSGLTQNVNFVTHTSGHTLDFVITREDDDLIHSVTAGDMIADHSAIIALLHIQKPSLVKKKVAYRKIKAIDMDNFANDIVSQTNSSTSVKGDVNAKCNEFTALLRTILDKHAPLRTMQVTIRPKVSWHNDSIAKAKREKRKCESKWRKSRLEIHKARN
jgi:hypothetical protein